MNTPSQLRAAFNWVVRSADIFSEMCRKINNLTVRLEATEGERKRRK